MLPRNKLLLLLAGVALIAGLPALAQDKPESILPPGFGDPATPKPAPVTATTPKPAATSTGSVERNDVVEVTPAEIGAEAVAALRPVPQVELPIGSRRDASLVGPLPPGSSGFGDQLWGASSGKFLSILLHRTKAPLASRWGHVMVRNALLTGGNAPGGVHPADWVAERSWLLLRMGEADAARLLVAGVDVRDFTPKLYQVGTQVALASADPSALCPIKDGISRNDGKIKPLVDAMCASLSGNSEVAASDIETSRRRGRYEQIDLTLAAKVVGAGADTARAATVEWEPVDQLTIWRFGLAAATGIVLPEKLLAKAPPRLLAWQARAPMLTPSDRLAAARVATGLGVFSSQALIDLYSQVFDSTDPDSLAQTDAWQLRLAMVGADTSARVAAIRKLLANGKSPLEKEASRALVARAASLIAPDSDLEDIAPDLIAAMLASGNQPAADRWMAVIGDMSDAARARCWAMLALASPTPTIDTGELDNFLGEDDSTDRQRSALLVAGLAGLGKISAQEAGRISAKYELGLGRRNVWTETIDGASLRRQAGTVAVLAAVGLQAQDFNSVPGVHQFHLVTALRRNGLDFYARMIAAEALART
ncbi:MAG: hypothetical protein ABI412_03210 [Sphingomicrobium sp.]